MTDDANLELTQDLLVNVSIGLIATAVGGAAFGVASKVGLGAVEAGALSGTAAGISGTAADGVYEGRDPSVQETATAATVGAVTGASLSWAGARFQQWLANKAVSSAAEQATTMPTETRHALLELEETAAQEKLEGLPPVIYRGTWKTFEGAAKKLADKAFGPLARPEERAAVALADATKEQTPGRNFKSWTAGYYQGKPVIGEFGSGLGIVNIDNRAAIVNVRDAANPKFVGWLTE